MKNSVELIDYMGSDKTHSLAAWASTFLELDLELPTDIEPRVDILVDYILSNSKRMRNIEDLLKFLATHQHTSPFRFSGFIFGMTTEIATHIQKLKSTVLLEAENGESARYKELVDKYYLPEDWKDIKSKNSVSFGEDWLDIRQESWLNILENYTKLGNDLYHNALKDLTPILGRQRAKESARFFKTYNSQINTMNKFSFDGVVQFYYKRNIPEAQLEIREIAVSMIDCIKSIPNNPFKYSLQAFNL